jgi:hypothetical protein
MHAFLYYSRYANGAWSTLHSFVSEFWTSLRLFVANMTTLPKIPGQAVSLQFNGMQACEE